MLYFGKQMFLIKIQVAFNRQNLLFEIVLCNIVIHKILIFSTEIFKEHSALYDAANLVYNFIHLSVKKYINKQYFSCNNLL